MNTSIEHMRHVNELAEYCGRHDLTIFEHQYNYMVFGSWVLAVGTSKHRMKYSWDGKEFYLGVSSSEFQNSNSVPNWSPVVCDVGGSKTTESEVFTYIQASLDKQYAI